MALTKVSNAIRQHVFVGDGVTDSTAAVYAAIQAATEEITFEGDIVLNSLPAYTASGNVYIPVIGKNNFKINAANARFLVNYDFAGNTQTGVVFGIMGSSNVYIDQINAYAPSNATSKLVYGFTALQIKDDGTNGSKDIFVGGVDCEFVAQCIQVTTTGSDSEYQTNGFDSLQRSSNIFVGNAHMKNGTVISDAGYGISLQFSGDNFTCANARFETTHRAMIAYGVRNVKAHMWATDGAAAQLALGGYGSIENFDLFLKDDSPDTTQATAAPIFQILAHDTNTSGGGSIDLAAGRQHVMTNIKLNLDVAVAARGATGYVGKEEPSTADGDIYIANIEITGASNGCSSGLRIGQGYPTTNPTNYSNLKFENIVVRNYQSNDSSQVTVSTAFKNSPVFENYTGSSIFAGYQGSVNDCPAVLKNCSIAEITTSNKKDVYMVLENCHINRYVDTNYRIQPFNKSMVNTRIGNSDPITKDKHDIYSNVTAPSNALYSPENAQNYLVGGAFYEGNNTNAAIDLDIVAETAANKPTSTTSRGIDHASFVNTTDYVPRNTKQFKIYVRDTSATIAAIYTGYFSFRGSALTDFSACTLKLHDVAVTNLIGSSYLVGDLTMSTPDADTIRFSMSRASENMIIHIFNT